MERSKVIVVPCENYNEETVYHAMKTGIQALGGIGCFVKPEEKILVKTNFLSVADKDSAIVTHPSVIKGMLRILNEEGYGDVCYGDSPGHGSSKAAIRKLGIDESSSFGAKMADMNEEAKVHFEQGKTCKDFVFTKEVVEADAIINLCKMKTHALERITGAVKNVYGYVCGMNKATGHTKFPNDTIFARMLCDIHAYKKPRLSIMDGIVAMEGNGPASGKPVQMKVMLFSADPVALDTVFCYLVDLDPELVPTCSQGEVLGVGTDREENIDIIVAHPDNSGSNVIISRSELLDKYGSRQFDVPRKKARLTFLKGFSDVMTRFARRPAINKDQCIKCGICVNHCPVPGKAVDFVNGKDKPPVYDYKKCIRCYCCQEMCPQHAIYVRGKN
ncbi:MAG: DUF362 domain-containing protein [Lachnospiraceae bacterium]|nr:DUF362 domain-containing protein [Lachnospiraceae bacterium]